MLMLKEKPKLGQKQTKAPHIDRCEACWHSDQAKIKP
jgi:hypothetical protein